MIDMVNENHSRLKGKAGGEEAAMVWGADVFWQFRQLRSTTGEVSELRTSLGER
jgi:hypothetical protein